MNLSPDPATQAQEQDSLTFGDLCYAIEKGRLEVERHGSSYEVSVYEARRWSRRETAFRALLAPLSACLSGDLYGFA